MQKLMLRWIKENYYKLPKYQHQQYIKKNSIKQNGK